MTDSYISTDGWRVLHEPVICGAVVVGARVGSELSEAICGASVGSELSEAICGVSP